ncbi:MAG: hypothetical protein KGJ62_11615 [Armatimonadetes bacterium]|nr:hypothetical protein [Armatimonadota bacterium]MDE2206774.1 hypothetical protein [Armatimonadota bacterium]
MSRPHITTVRLTTEEVEWLRRKAHWDGVSASAVVRGLLHQLIAEQGYLRPPDDDPQDFGYEKEQMQFVLAVQSRVSNED